MGLTDYENDLLQECLSLGSHSSPTPYETQNTVLFWPTGWPGPERSASSSRETSPWYSESGVNQASDLACWLERVYEQMCEWMDFNPNEHYSCKNGMRHRLAFVCNGKEDFQLENDRGEPLPRPYIGLRDGDKPTKCGEEDWFGWLCHELSHDFLHEPRLGPDAACWGEGLCDYFRCKLLSALRMNQAAANFEQRIKSCTAPDDKYHQPAKLLLEYECKRGFTSPSQLVQSVRHKPLCLEDGFVTWG